MTLKFDMPTPTKSGRRVSEIWHELLEQWQIFKTARQIDGQLDMYVSARRIRFLQNDLGISIATFPELNQELLKFGEIYET